MSELVTCPFCGSDCACINYTHVNGKVHFYAAFCCGQLDYHDTALAAENEWNHRTHEPGPKETT